MFSREMILLVNGNLTEGFVVIVTPKAVKKERKLSFKKFWSLIKETNPPKGIAFAAVLLSIIETGIGLVIPLFTQRVVDSMAQAALNPGFFVVFILLFILQAISTGVSIYLLTYVGEHVVRGLRVRLWTNVLRLPVAYFDQTKAGETVSRITNDTNIVKGLITRHLVSAFTGVLSITGAIVILLYLDWQMTLVMLSAVPVLLFIIIPIGRKMYRISKSIQGEMAEFTGVLSQVLSEIRLVKAYSAESNEGRRGENKIQHLFFFGLKEAKVMAILRPLISLVMMAMLVFIIGYGGVRVASGIITAGELVAFILYLFMIIIPVSQFTTFFAEVQKAMGATERMNEIFDKEQEPFSSQGRTGISEDAQTLHIKNVNFSYENQDTVLTDISFSVPAEKVTAVVGPSGSGKSTIFSLIERFYQVDSGSIFIGEKPIEQVDLKQWRSRIGYVSQESPLMSGTIVENMTYGMEEKISMEHIEVAAKAANAEEFILELPKKYETEVGERGIKLSGGQKQRIAIARALLRNPSILMLDEATASLDSKSEQKVQEALKNLMKGRTTLVIAHRLSTVVEAEQIVVIEKGKVTGAGRHDELYQTHDLYRELADHQMKLGG